MNVPFFYGGNIHLRYETYKPSKFHLQVAYSTTCVHRVFILLIRFDKGIYFHDIVNGF